MGVEQILTGPEKVELGQRLFTDQRLSTTGKIACISCHLSNLAFTDGKPVAVGVEGRKGTRNAPTLLNAGLLKHLFWDGRVPSLEEGSEVMFTQSAIVIENLISKYLFNSGGDSE